MKTLKTSNAIALFVAIALVGSSCSVKNRPIGSFYSYETECMGTSFAGSETVMTWGSGTTKQDAIEQAKKNALHTIIFDGIRKGKSGCSTSPLITVVNAEKKYASYFNNFFTDGNYNEFITVESKSSEIKKEKNDQEIKYGIIVSVNTAALRQKFINDNIIK